MTTVVLDTHALLWYAAEPNKLSRTALTTIRSSNTLAVAAITWYELAWLAENGRIALTIPTRTWLEKLSEQVVTLDLTPAIAATAAALPEPFPRDPADRIIYATAIEHGALLATNDTKLRKYPQPRKITVW